MERKSQAEINEAIAEAVGDHDSISDLEIFDVSEAKERGIPLRPKKRLATHGERVEARRIANRPWKDGK